MSRHVARVEWHREGDFAKKNYQRSHTWVFDGGITVPASASPAVVPIPQSRPDAVDPEEALVAAASSCHMLTFLFLAAEAGLVVRSYRDDAWAELEKDPDGGRSVHVIHLSPVIEWETAPATEKLAQLHHRAHNECFIARSLKASVEVSG
jgi:organic hydroperoxide reductase OsmC/OhrA